MLRVWLRFRVNHQADTVGLILNTILTRLLGVLLVDMALGVGRLWLRPAHPWSAHKYILPTKVCSVADETCKQYT